MGTHLPSLSLPFSLLPPSFHRPSAPSLPPSLPHPPSLFFLFSIVDSIRGFAHAACFAAAPRCLRFLVIMIIITAVLSHYMVDTEKQALGAHSPANEYQSQYSDNASNYQRQRADQSNNQCCTNTNTRQITHKQLHTGAFYTRTSKGVIVLLLLIMVALWSRADLYIFILSFVLSSSSSSSFSFLA